MVTIEDRMLYSFECSQCGKYIESYMRSQFENNVGIHLLRHGRKNVKDGEMSQTILKADGTTAIPLPEQSRKSKKSEGRNPPSPTPESDSK